MTLPVPSSTGRPFRAPPNPDGADDDDVSITSTVESEQRSEYEVDTILSELAFPDGVKYLVKWEGYPMERCTWEPEESFDDPRTLQDWRRKKQAIARGEIPEFDLEGWEDLVKAVEDARDERKRRRREKRIRLGLPVSTDWDASVGDAGMQEEKSDSENSLDNDPIIRDIPAKIPRPSDPSQPSTEPAAGKRSSPRHDETRGIDRGGVKGSPSTASSTRPKLSISVPSQPTRKDPGQLSARKKSSPPSPTVASSGRGRALARRTAPAMSRFGTRHPRTGTTGIQGRLQKVRTGQLAPSAPRRFTSLSTVWRYEKISRAEPEPDITQLELRRPSEWLSNQSNSNNARWTAEIDSLFVEQDSPGASPSGDMEGTPTTDLPSPQRPQLSRRVSEDSSHRRPELPRPHKRISSWDVAQEAAGEKMAQSPHTLAASSSSPSPLATGPRTDRWPMNRIDPPREPRAARKGGMPNAPPHLERPFRTWNPGEVMVSMYYGPSKQEVGQVRICGVTAVTRTKLLSLKANHRITIWFQHLCTLEQYTFLCERMQNVKYCNGWIDGYEDTIPEINKMATHLCDQDVIGICYLTHTGGIQNVLVAYPAMSETFAFFNQDARYPLGLETPLRLVVRSTLAPIETLPVELSLHVSSPRRAAVTDGLAERRSPPPERPAPPTPCQEPAVLLHPDPHSQPSQSVSQGPYRGEPDVKGESTDIEMTDVGDVAANIDLDVVFREQYGITFSDLARVNSEKRDNRARIFYLMFPADAQGECEIVLRFLKKHNVITFSNRVAEDWERFAQVVDQGVVLFHGDFIHFETLPYLRDLFRKPVNFWSLSLAAPLKYADSPIHIQRLFPHGGVILLTEDFMVREQDATVIILAWFRDWVRKRFPGTWKLMFRPDIENWLLSRHRGDRKNGHWIAMYHLLRELLPEEYQDHAQGDEPRELDGLDDEGFPVLSLAKLPDYGRRSEDDHPAIPKGLTQEQRNTDHLIEFFAGWGLVHHDRFRRFVAVTSMEPLARWKEWHHLELRHGGRNFLKSFQVDYRSYWDKLTATVKSRLSTSTASTSSTPTATATATAQPQSQPQQATAISSSSPQVQVPPCNSSSTPTPAPAPAPASVNVDNRESTTADASASSNSPIPLPPKPPQSLRSPPSGYNYPPPYA
ncbi:hypothetical protein VTN02DRAFT_367 [Thermoascus thermophilus]